jgi:hypothetical protein
MNKEQMINLLRSVGVTENTITVMVNAYDLGFDMAKEQAVQMARGYELQVLADDLERLTP